MIFGNTLMWLKDSNVNYSISPHSFSSLNILATLHLPAFYFVLNFHEHKHEKYRYNCNGAILLMVWDNFENLPNNNSRLKTDKLQFKCQHAKNTSTAILLNIVFKQQKRTASVCAFHSVAYWKIDTIITANLEYNVWIYITFEELLLARAIKTANVAAKFLAEIQTFHSKFAIIIVCACELTSTSKFLCAKYPVCSRGRNHDTGPFWDYLINLPAVFEKNFKQSLICSTCILDP